MRLYLDAKSKNNIGYTPDWLKIDYEENETVYTLTLDLQGDIDYNEDTLSCRYKGDLIPWVLNDNETGDEYNLYGMDDDTLEFFMPVEKIISIIENGSNYVVGIYPVFEKDLDLAEDDELSDCCGSISIYYDGKEIAKEFVFETELNIF